MPRAPSPRELQPRRRPRRRSGKQIVTALLDAAQEQLIDKGLAGLTTNAIARRAGVSIGSLYQYFSNKEAIVVELTRRVNANLEKRMLAAGERASTPRAQIEAILASYADPRDPDLKVRRALLLEIPRSWVETTYREVEERLVAWIAIRATQLWPNRSPRQLEHEVIVRFFAVRGAVQAALLHQPELLQKRWFIVHLNHIAAGEGPNEPARAAADAPIQARDSDADDLQ